MAINDDTVSVPVNRPRGRPRKHPRPVATSVYPHSCAQCGKQWLSKRREAKFCSSLCHGRHRIGWKKQQPRPCKQCGISYIPKTKDARARFCSARCVKRNRKGFKPPESRPCRQCGKAFTPPFNQPYKEFCSRYCAMRNWLARNPGTDKGDNRKRARKYGVPYESVNRIKVFERDGWRCQICHRNTPRDRIGKRSKNAPSLDHRIPISKGGPHTYANCQCACLDCNLKKHNCNQIGQMPLFEITMLKGGYDLKTRRGIG